MTFTLGEFEGEALKGKIKGVDFLELRADGRKQLNIQAKIITDDGECIALNETGLMTTYPGELTADLHLTMVFSIFRKSQLAEQGSWLGGQTDRDGKCYSNH